MIIYTVQRCKAGAQGAASFGVELFTDEQAAREWAETQRGPLMRVLVQAKTVHESDRCSVWGCELNAVDRGWCFEHFARWRAQQIEGQLHLEGVTA